MLIYTRSASHCKAFLWEYQFVQGRQLATTELQIWSGRPDMWKQFCVTADFLGLINFKATVDSWGTFHLSHHQLDCLD